MAGKRSKYTPEFKLQAVKTITEQRLAVARRLGISEDRLHDWKKAVAAHGADAAHQTSQRGKPNLR